MSIRGPDLYRALGEEAGKLNSVLNPVREEHQGWRVWVFAAQGLTQPLTWACRSGGWRRIWKEGEQDRAGGVSGVNERQPTLHPSLGDP